MTLNFFNQKPKTIPPARADAMNTVRQWLNDRPYLPYDLRRALYRLLPELRPRGMDEFDHDPPHED